MIMGKKFDKKRAADIYFCQRHGAPWESYPYWDGCMDYNACGLVSLTMAIDILTGQELTPADVYKIRAVAGIDQLHMVTKDGKHVCGGDAQPQFNPVYEKLFGIRSEPLERSTDAFREVLKSGDRVIWASSRNTDFYSNDRSVRNSHTGHVLCFWDWYADSDSGEERFIAKDPGEGREMCNNVYYTVPQLEKWLAANPWQQYAIRAVD